MNSLKTPYSITPILHSVSLEGFGLAKKKSKEQEIRRGLEELRGAGIAVDELSASLVASLKEQMGKSRTMDFGIVFTLGRIADPSAVEALIDLESVATDKDIKKQIRRSLFKLSQRGLAVPEERGAEGKAPVPLFGATSNIEGYMSAVDGAGGRLVWMLKPLPGAGLDLIQGLVSDRAGLQRVGGARLRRKELRRMAQDMKEQHGVAMIAVPWEYADQLLSEGFERAKAQGRSGLEEFQELRSAMYTGKPSVQVHPVYRRIAADEARGGAWREQSRRLLDEPEMRFWLVDADWIEPFLPQLEEARTSRLVLNPVQKEERLAGIVRDVVKMLSAEEPGKVMQRRMEDIALYFAETGRQQQAKLALAVALLMGEGDPGPLDVSFLTGLVQKSFAFHLAQKEKKSGEEPSLIVKP